MSRVLYIIMCMFLAAAVTPAAGAKDYVIVIDPGHGGKDAGALGAHTTEKSINLNVGLKLKELIEDNMDDVKVEMTRSTDKFIALQERADFANRKHADIFISIHANSVSKKSPTHSTVNGAAVYTLGLDRSDTNLSVAMRENEVMKLESDYTTTYQGFDPSSTESYIAFEMMQHKNMDQSIALAEAVQNQLVCTAGRKNNGVRQAPFWVLVRTSMPSILVELDFICNPTMETFMASDAGSTKLARAIFNGVERFRASSARPPRSKKAGKKEPEPQTVTVTQSPEPAEVKNETPATSSATGDTVFRIQFMTSPRALPEGDRRFKGLKDVSSYREGNTVKYVYGTYPTSAAAAADLKKVKQNFPDAFVIKMCDGKRIK